MSSVRAIVLDTGVLVSAAIRPQSIPALAVEKAMVRFDVCASAETLAELRTLLLRPKFDSYVSLGERRKFLAELRRRVIELDVPITVTDCIDPKDNKFLALAEVAEAEVILSSDPYLTELHPWRGIPILPPAAFLAGIR